MASTNSALNSSATFRRAAAVSRSPLCKAAAPRAFSSKALAGRGTGVMQAPKLRHNRPTIAIRAVKKTKPKHGWGARRLLKPRVVWAGDGKHMRQGSALVSRSCAFPERGGCFRCAAWSMLRAMSESEPQPAAAPLTTAPITAAAAPDAAESGAVAPAAPAEVDKSRAKARKGRKKSPVVEVPEDERWLLASGPRPTTAWRRSEQNLTLVLLAAITGVGALIWFSAKWWLNDHTPDGQQYVPAELPVLSNRPKDAALEFHHLLCVLDFDRAAQLASPSAQALVAARRSACDEKCLKTRRQRVKATQTRAALLTSQGREATARAECFADGKVDAAEYALRLEGPGWLVSGVAAK
jgi:hypothetical protein